MCDDGKVERFWGGGHVVRTRGVPVCDKQFGVG